MRNGWKKVNLSDLYDITSSKRVFKSDWVSEGVPFYRAREIVKIEKEGSVNNELFITSEMYEKYKDKYGVPVCGDVLITAVGTLGVCYNVKKNDKFYFKDGNVIWLKQKNNQIDSFFLKYQFKTKSVLEHVNAHKGAVVGTYTIEKAKATKIILPPLEEQQKIVEKLDKAFEYIDQAKANIEQNIVNAKELFQSKLNQFFTESKNDWDIDELINISKFIDYRGRTPVKTKSGIRLITAKNVKLGYLNIQPQEFIAEDDYESWMTRGIPNFGDIIFTTEAPLANVAQINLKEKLAFAQRIIVIQPYVSIIYQDFLKYSLISKVIRDNILSKATGATVQGIKSSLLKKVLINYPKSLIEQKRIIEILDRLQINTNRLINEYELKLSNLEELRKSILEKAFKGELTN